MLIVSKRCRDIAGDLSSLLYAPSVPPPLWRWWPYREGVEWVAATTFPPGPLTPSPPSALAWHPPPKGGAGRRPAAAT